MTAISRLGYLGFEVSNLAEWERFTVEVLGLVVSERRPDGSLVLRMDDQAQRIVLHPGPRDDLAYRATLSREGLNGPEGVLAVGNEDAVREQLGAFEGAGATDLRVNALCSTPEESERTRTFLRVLCHEKNR